MAAPDGGEIAEAGIWTGGFGAVPPTPVPPPPTGSAGMGVPTLVIGARGQAITTGSQWVSMGGQLFLF